MTQTHFLTVLGNRRDSRLLWLAHPAARLGDNLCWFALLTVVNGLAGTTLAMASVFVACGLVTGCVGLLGSTQPKEPPGQMFTTAAPAAPGPWQALS